MRGKRLANRAPFGGAPAAARHRGSRYRRSGRTRPQLLLASARPCLHWFRCPLRAGRYSTNLRDNGKTGRKSILNTQTASGACDGNTLRPNVCTRRSRQPWPRGGRAGTAPARSPMALRLVLTLGARSSLIDTADIPQGVHRSPAGPVRASMGAQPRCRPADRGSTPNSSWITSCRKASSSSQFSFGLNRHISHSYYYMRGFNLCPAETILRLLTGIANTPHFGFGTFTIDPAMHSGSVLSDRHSNLATAAKHSGQAVIELLRNSRMQCTSGSSVTLSQGL